MKKLTIVSLVVFLLIVTGGWLFLGKMEYDGKKVEDLKNYSVATFSGGCFWCSERDFEQLFGVMEVISGNAGGIEENPTYQEVSSGQTSHREAIQVYYDSDKVSYEELLERFWTHIDPTDDEGQFVDRGNQYTSAIFYHNDEQKELALKSKEYLENSKRFSESIVTKVLPFTSFYSAEEYHQDYYKKNPIRYKFYRSNSGRDQFIEKNWKSDIFKDDLKNKLTSVQYEVTQNNGTELAFDNAYWNNTREGIYVDIISGEPLFSSVDKYKSGTGWPSFTKPIDESNMVEKEDNGWFVRRTEIRSRESDSHIGHVFNDGPSDSTGLRYCMNSAALRFVPIDDLEKEGYGEFLVLFE